jgi:hypothetical protein
MIRQDHRGGAQVAASGPTHRGSDIYAFAQPTQVGIPFE